MAAALQIASRFQRPIAVELPSPGHMYCPHCGVNNDRGEGKCFVCEKNLPALNAPVAAAAPAERARAARRDAAEHPVFASVGDRMIALIFDRIVVTAILLAVAAWAADYWRVQSVNAALSTILAAVGAIVVVTFLYHFISEAAFLTTVGKAAMGLHVGVEEGRNRVAATALRNLLRIVDAIGGYLIGFLFATFSLRRQRVGDLVGRTVVLDWPIARGGRAAMMVMIVLIVAAAVWIASVICPACMIRPIRP
jgi:uncharacterized RDD family membrane protein YckC